MLARKKKINIDQLQKRINSRFRTWFVDLSWLIFGLRTMMITNYIFDQSSFINLIFPYISCSNGIFFMVKCSPQKILRTQQLPLTPAARDCSLSGSSPLKGPTVPGKDIQSFWKLGKFGIWTGKWWGVPNFWKLGKLGNPKFGRTRHFQKLGSSTQRAAMIIIDTLKKIGCLHKFEPAKPSTTTSLHGVFPGSFWTTPLLKFGKFMASDCLVRCHRCSVLEGDTNRNPFRYSDFSVDHQMSLLKLPFGGAHISKIYLPFFRPSHTKKTAKKTGIQTTILFKVLTHKLIKMEGYSNHLLEITFGLQVWMHTKDSQNDHVNRPRPYPGCWQCPQSCGP